MNAETETNDNDSAENYLEAEKLRGLADKIHELLLEEQPTRYLAIAALGLTIGEQIIPDKAEAAKELVNQWIDFGVSADA